MNRIVQIIFNRSKYIFKEIGLRINYTWKRIVGAGVSSTRGYDDYQTYVDHQKEKTTDQGRIEKWKGQEWHVKLAGFKNIFNRNQEYVSDRKNALCLGARTGQEVKALLDLGIQAIGIDLVPFPPYTIAGDIHHLSYADGAFDFVFTNIFDHALYPDRFCNEMERVTEPGGIIMIHLQLGIVGDEYTETVVYDPAHVLKMFSCVSVRESKSIKNTFDGMNWELVLQKN